MEFQNKVALVTGSGNGIGRSIAMAFAREGASVIIADIDEHDAIKTKQEIEQLGGKASAFRADVSVSNDVQQLFSFIKENYGTLDILVNNVGTTIRKPIVHFTEEEWDFVFDTNIKSMFLCAKEAGKIMLKKQSGVVVNISSILGLGGVSRRLPYATSKAAVDSFTKTIACEWALDGIRVNTIAPGYILTESLKGAFEQGILSEDDMVRRTPQAHLGTPDNIADAALFLSSDKAAFITGTVLYVDGGYAAYNGPEVIPSFHHNLE
ncbi:glucose 1-dehydrogenase [Paenibacillus psychroresistens]|uniref:Glucose 1-dehydrogenase n=1 Tax=Paenibacillus psychroresistens TaxID=1778678 RepID=A0A6B8REE4_9BACL|nr:glucose 1-dehydrogenase [Paenibacillus psychroresistens]QGQ94287.1 glucose 1-dehydrogenase [Paenibacillus psychroresistens]